MENYVIGYVDFYIKIDEIDNIVFFVDKHIISTNDQFFIKKSSLFHDKDYMVQYGADYYQEYGNYGSTFLRYKINDKSIYFKQIYDDGDFYVNIDSQNLKVWRLYEQESNKNIVHEYYKDKYIKVINFSKKKDNFFYDYKTKKGKFYNKNKLLCSFIIINKEIKYIKKNRNYRISEDLQRIVYNSSDKGDLFMAIPIDVGLY